MAGQQLCFVLMPFGIKPDGSGGSIDFDAVYRDIIEPAIRASELDPLRADEEMTGRIIPKPMLQPLVLLPFPPSPPPPPNPNPLPLLRRPPSTPPPNTHPLFPHRPP